MKIKPVVLFLQRRRRQTRGRGGYWKSFRNRINTDDIGNVIAFAPFGKHLYDDIGSDKGFRLLVEHTVNWVLEYVPLVFPIKQ